MTADGHHGCVFAVEKEGPEGAGLPAGGKIVNVPLRASFSVAMGIMFVCGCGRAEEHKAVSAAEPLPDKAVPSFVPPAALQSDEVVVTVNGKVFTRGMALDMVRKRVARQGIPPQYMEQFIAQRGESMVKQAADEFIDMTLMREEAERRAEKVEDSEIDAVIAQITNGLPPGMTLEQALATEGATIAKLREDIAAGERMKKLYDAEAPASNLVSDADVDSFYKDNQKIFTSEESADVRHILIGCKEGATAEERAAAKANAESVRTQLVAGADFAELAAATSSCPSKAQGGNLGSVRRGQMVPEFEKASFSQEVGAIGPVVETQFGYHVVQVTKRQEAGVTPLSEVSEKIREHLSAQKRQKTFAAYLKTLRGPAKIEYPRAAVKDEAPAAKDG